jgi:alkanesulfonate monooxygenase SsuD/methylene tetrahydromethanopterin reductase-like flavin-dependent oxidoreductase (luciferase family)
LEAGVRTGQRLAGTFNYLAAQLLSAREAYPSRSYPSLGLLPQLRQEVSGPDEGGRVPEGICIGDPERITGVIRQWESVGADRINFLLNAAETVSQDEVLASLRLFAKEVMPKFQPAVADAAAVGRQS